MIRTSYTQHGFYAEYETMEGKQDTVSYPYANIRQVKNFIKEDLENTSFSYMHCIIVIRQHNTHDVVSVKPDGKKNFIDLV